MPPWCLSGATVSCVVLVPVHELRHGPGPDLRIDWVSLGLAKTMLGQDQMYENKSVNA